MADGEDDLGMTKRRKAEERVVRAAMRYYRKHNSLATIKRVGASGWVAECGNLHVRLCEACYALSRTGRARAKEGKR